MASRVLIARPQPEAERTAARIAALGLDSIVLPVSRAVPLDDPLAEAAARRWSAVAVTSINAVRAISARPELAQAWRSLPLFAVGSRTAEAAAAIGFEDIRTADGTGRSLAQAVVRTVRATVPRTAEPLLYCAGQQREGSFEKNLAAANIPYRTCECYRMEDLSYDTEYLRRVLVATPVDVALFYSQRQASRFFSLLGDAGLLKEFQVRRILCLSGRIAAAVPDSLRSIAAIADCPSEDHLLEMLAAIRT